MEPRKKKALFFSLLSITCCTLPMLTSSYRFLGIHHCKIPHAGVNPPVGGEDQGPMQYSLQTFGLHHCHKGPPEQDPLHKQLPQPKEASLVEDRESEPLALDTIPKPPPVEERQLESPGLEAMPESRAIEYQGPEPLGPDAISKPLALEDREPEGPVLDANYYSHSPTSVGLNHCHKPPAGQVGIEHCKKPPPEAGVGIDP